MRHDELIADTFAHAACLVSVITADATLTHWQLSNTIVPLLAHHGESLPRTLAASAPFPLAAEDAVTDGAVIDLRARRLRYWTTDTVSPGLVAGLVDAAGRSHPSVEVEARCSSRVRASAPQRRLSCSKAIPRSRVR